MNQEFDFETWFDIFQDKCKSLGYEGPLDREIFKEDYDAGLTPEEAAENQCE